MEIPAPAFDYDNFIQAFNLKIEITTAGSGSDSFG